MSEDFLESVQSTPAAVRDKDANKVERIKRALRKHPGISRKRLASLACMRDSKCGELVAALIAAGAVVDDAEHKGPGLPQKLFLVEEPGEDERKAMEAAHARVDPELHVNGAPEDFSLIGASTLNIERADDGTVKRLQWVKTKRNAQSPERLLQIFKMSVADADIPAAQPTPITPGVYDPDLLAVYPFGDPHFGLLSWHLETGEDFDLAIAETNILGAVRDLSDRAPPAETALFVDLGDFFHSDNLEGTTMRSGHKLDVDSRWPKVLRVGLRAKIACIRLALRKHKTVHVIIEIGNHDDHTSMMLALCLAEHFRDEPRVIIDTSPSTFHWFEFGLNFFGTTHGHNTKPADLPQIMATDKPLEWGRTRYRYWLCGHIHHERKIEFRGCLVEFHRTLAAKDAWSHSKGYRAGRSMLCDIHHRTRGRIMRLEVDIKTLEEANEQDVAG